MISRLIYNKGVIEFFKATRLLRNNKNLHFELLGREIDDNLNEIKQFELKKYKNQNNLKISNFTSNVKKKLKNVNFVVLPSYREGMPKSLMEAMASGIPVIASKVEGNSELVKNNFNGFLCNPRDVNDLYNNIIKFINLNYDQKIKFGLNSRKIAKNYDEKIVIKRYQEVIDER